jgi:hypothetical protein
MERLEDRRLMHADHDHTEAKALAAVYSEPAALAEVAAVQAAAVSTDPAIAGRWNTVASWNQEAVNAVMLPTGKVMVWNYTVNSTFLWDPVTDTYSTPSQPDWNTFCAGQSLLADGRLFVAGGHVAGAAKGTQPGDGAPDAGIYNPLNNTWTKLPPMNRGRWYPEVVTLGDGNALVLSGNTGYDGFGANGVPQMWNFATNSWKTYTQAKLTDFQYPRTFQAPNGKVFEAGPGSISRYFDPAGNGLWTVGPTTIDGNRLKGTAVMYDNGKVIIIGGASDNPNPPIASSEVIDLNQANPAWRKVDSMEFARKNINATIMADGSLLVVGGTTGVGTNNKDLPVLPAEIWDPDTEQWTTVASAAFPHWYHSTSLLLPDGRVLVMGGVDTTKAEIYSPPYLFKGARPTIGAAPFSVIYNQTVTVKTPNAADIRDVYMVRYGSATHAFNFDQGVEHLNFTRTADGTGLRVTTPPSGNDAVPGYYMMFIVNSQGVPSVSRIVHLGPTIIPVPRTTATASALAESTADTDGVAQHLAAPATGGSDSLPPKWKPFIGPLTLEESVRRFQENHPEAFDIAVAFAQHLASKARRSQLHDLAVAAQDILGDDLVAEIRSELKR